ncbi:hypothetical protein [Bradyrhizobium sp. ORS 285]|uniref:hypothetical protein n=1 Tax=Bradyrhizobium sp. ORS 285 TaxID=115808 RepID=UPI00055368EA|nr:hypothetical protein [Bradyrhizobium sp. ORS 285]
MTVVVFEWVRIDASGGPWRKRFSAVGFPRQASAQGSAGIDLAPKLRSYLTMEDAMRFGLIVVLMLFVSGCMTDNGGNSLVQSTVFAQPAVVYHTGDNLEVSYYNGGLQQSYNERNAMELLKKECGGAFRIVGRSNAPSGDAYVDAVCVR